MTVANTIFRGPIEREPRTLNLPVAGAYLPGIIVTENGSALTVAGTADKGKEVLVLANRDFYGQDLDTAYASGDTGVAYFLEIGQVFQARLAAATYAKGDPLTLAANGYLTAAVATDVVYARFEGTAGAKSAGDRDDVRIANSYVKA